MRKWIRVMGMIFAVHLVVVVFMLLLRSWDVETNLSGDVWTAEAAESTAENKEVLAQWGSGGDAENIGSTEINSSEGDTDQAQDRDGERGAEQENGQGGLRQEISLTEQELIDRGKVIYLTFDDGPSVYTEELLDILAKYNVKATFFVTGGFPDYVDMIGREKEEGHTVGIHCYRHDYNQVYASEEAYFADLQKIDDIIFEQTGERAQLVRFPGGSSNASSKFNPGIMTRLTKLVEEKGYHYYDWNVLSGDAGDTKDTEQIIQNVIEGIQKKGIAVVLQHDLYEYSVNAVEEIIIWGLENGYTFLPLTMDSPTIHHPVAN